MIRHLIKLLVRKELNKIEYENEIQFYDRICNKFNNGFDFNKKNKKRR